MNRKSRTAGTAEELRSFLAETIRRSEFSLRQIKCSDQSHWSIQNGVLSHFSNGFFHVAGIKHRLREEEHLILYQPQSALNGLALFRDGADVFLLLQARIEPGLAHIGEYGPTVQSTAANYLRLHGGKETTYIDLFRGYNPLASPLGNISHTDLGRRYFQKNKVLSYVELCEPVAAEENMIWVPLPVLREVLAEDHFLNPDLRSLLSVFDWDLYRAGDLVTQPTGGTPTLTLPAGQLGKNEWRLIPVEQLSGWEFQEYGVADVSGSGIWVDMFQVSCFSREVREWSQPLLSCANEGLVLLLVRMIDGRYEFLVTLESEFGISGQKTIHPSFVRYPGDNFPHLPPKLESETVLVQMKQSEEGGRFYQNESLYQLILTADDRDIAANQRWINGETVKSILNSPGQASIQLRCIASLALDLLNPLTFA